MENKVNNTQELTVEQLDAVNGGDFIDDVLNKTEEILDNVNLDRLKKIFWC